MPWNSQNLELEENETHEWATEDILLCIYLHIAV
jgi:hypothetical protein